MSSAVAAFLHAIRTREKNSISRKKWYKSFCLDRFLWSRSGAAQPQIRERNPANRICTWKNNYLKVHFRVGFFCCFDARVRNERKNFVFVRVTFKESDIVILRAGVQVSVCS